MTDPTDGPEEGGPVFRDRRRIDPTTYQVREPAPGGAAPGPAGEGAADPRPGDPLDAGLEDLLAGAAGQGIDSVALDADLAELTADLQRLSAEYANYRKRVERDREAVRETAVAGVLAEMLPVLDDVGRARQHGELDGAFRSVGESLEAVVAKLGLESYGRPGDPFDPAVHEALTAVPTEDSGDPVVLEVFQPGYLFKARVVRPARVVVTQPAAPAPPEGGATV